MKPQRAWAKPIGLVYGHLMNCRKWFYQKGILSKTKVNVPVISVGNLTVGGTGKTPFVMNLISLLKSSGHRPAVVSRGYGRKGQDILSVDLKSGNHEQFGDEPLLIKIQNPETPVWVGPLRSAVAIKLLENHLDCDVIVADDAFQHLALERDLDILLFDASQSLDSLAPMPWGLGRELPENMERAEVLVLNKINLSSEDQLQGWRTWIALNKKPHQILVEARYKNSELRSLSGHSLSLYPGSRVLACAGIGNPGAFLKLLETEYQLSVQKKIWKKDHFDFDSYSVSEIVNSAESLDGIVITEKDAVKWRHLDSRLLQKVWVAAVQVEIVKGKDEFIGILNRKVR